MVRALRALYGLRPQVNRSVNPPSTSHAVGRLLGECIYTHIPSVRFTWDPRKSARNLADRGDIAFAAGIFTGPTVERLDARRDYGEVRRLAIGRVASIVLPVIYTDRIAPDGARERRIISARVRKRRERNIYDQAYPQA